MTQGGEIKEHEDGKKITQPCDLGEQEGSGERGRGISKIEKWKEKGTRGINISLPAAIEEKQGRDRQ